MMLNDCSSEERGARSVFLTYISESHEGDEDTKCDVETNSTVESGEGKKGWQLSNHDSKIRILL